MRSEERAGIISIVLLFLWGTLLSEPFRVPCDLFCSVVTAPAGDDIGRLYGFVVILIFAVMSCGMMILTKTPCAKYIPCAILGITLTAMVIRSLQTRDFSLRSYLPIVIATVITALFYITSAEKIIIWEADFFALSPAVFLAAGTILRPLSLINGVTAVIFYSGSAQRYDLSAPFDGTFNLPGVIFTGVMCICLLLPTCYYAAGRKKA